MLKVERAIVMNTVYIALLFYHALSAMLKFTKNEMFLSYLYL